MIEYLLAGAAGVATIASPCILPVLPIVLATTAGRGRVEPLLIIAGFIATFAAGGILLGALAGSSGNCSTGCARARSCSCSPQAWPASGAAPFEWLVTRVRGWFASSGRGAPARSSARQPGRAFAGGRFAGLGMDALCGAGAGIGTRAGGQFAGTRQGHCAPRHLRRRRRPADAGDRLWRELGIRTPGTVHSPSQPAAQSLRRCRHRRGHAPALPLRRRLYRVGHAVASRHD